MNIVGVTGQAGAGKDEVAARLVEDHDYVQMALADPIKRFILEVFEFDKVQLWGPSSARNAFDPRYVKCEIRSSGVSFGPNRSIGPVKRVCDAAWGSAAKRLLEYAPGWLAKVYPSGDQDFLLNSLCRWFTTLGHKFPELSPRIVTQYLGTEWGRETVDEDIWVNLLLREARWVLQGHPYTREEGVKIDLSKDPQQDAPEGVVVSDIRFKNELSALIDAGGRLIKVVRPETDKKAREIGIKGHSSELEQQSFTADKFDAVLQNKGSLSDLKKAVDALVPSLEVKKTSIRE